MKTKVLFRMFQGEALALFPAEAGSVGKPQTCTCYAQCGQHGAADVGIIGRSRPALPTEYASLKAELERIGYKLEIRQRTNRGDYLQRIQQLAA